MAKFRGLVGFALSAERTAPGVWEEQVVTRPYRGDIVRASRRLEEGQSVNPDITTGNSISIVADAFANEHFFAIRYVEWAGVLWTVPNVDVERPRLLLRLGGVYNGPTPTPAP